MTPKVLLFYLCNKYFNRNLLEKKFELKYSISELAGSLKSFSQKNLRYFINYSLCCKEQSKNNFILLEKYEHRPLSDFFGEILKNEIYLKSKTLLSGKYFSKKFKKSSVNDYETFLLCLRNKLFSLLELSSLGEKNPLKSEILFTNNQNDLLINRDKIAINEKDLHEIKINSIRRGKLVDLIKILQNKKRENKLKITSILNKIEREINNNKKEEEIFFTTSCTKPNRINYMNSSDLLYNSKTFLKNEEKFLQFLSNKSKLDAKRKIRDFLNLPMEVKKEKRIWNSCCQVCNKEDYHEKNKILYCDFCNVTVHQECVGLREIPKNDWICESCNAFGEKGKLLKCFLCSCRGGVFFQTRIEMNQKLAKLNLSYMQEIFLEKQKTPSNYYQCNKNKELQYQELSPEVLIELGLYKEIKEPKMKIIYDYHIQTFKFSEKELLDQPIPKTLWVHYSCAFWNPDLEYHNNSFHNFNFLQQRNFLDKCLICSKNDGYCVKCFHHDCANKFHVECARRVGFFMDEIRQSPKCIIFCGDHQPLQIKKDLKLREKTEIEEIHNFYQKLSKIFKNKKIDISKEKNEKNHYLQKKFKSSITSSMVKNSKITKIKKEDPKQRFKDKVKILVKGICMKFEDWKWSIKLEKQSENSYIIKSIKEPTKIYGLDKIEKNSIIWELASKKLKLEKKKIWKCFNFVSYKKRNNIGCIYCKKFGRGLNKCQGCWKYKLHSKCLDIQVQKKEEIINYLVYCPFCFKKYIKDIGRKEKGKFLILEQKKDQSAFLLKKVDFKDRFKYNTNSDLKNEKSCSNFERYLKKEFPHEKDFTNFKMENWDNQIGKQINDNSLNNSDIKNTSMQISPYFKRSKMKLKVTNYLFNKNNNAYKFFSPQQEKKIIKEVNNKNDFNLKSKKNSLMGYKIKLPKKKEHEKNPEAKEMNLFGFFKENQKHLKKKTSSQNSKKDNSDDRGNTDIKEKNREKKSETEVLNSNYVKLTTENLFPNEEIFPHFDKNIFHDLNETEIHYNNFLGKKESKLETINQEDFSIQISDNKSSLSHNKEQEKLKDFFEMTK